MSANDEFFRERHAQAVFKHGILRRYPTVFAAKTGRRGRPVMLLDGYAGRGEYEDGSPGSPALLVQTAEQVQDFRNVSGIYVEQDPTDFANLERVIAAHSRPDHTALCGDVRQHLPTILDRSRGSALLAFLDPFGTALDRTQLVNDLLCRDPREGPTEVLLHFSISTVARMGGILRQRRRNGIELTGKDRRTIAHGDSFLGGDWWHDYFEPVADPLSEERASDAALRVAARYAADIRQETGYKSASMPIRPAPGQQPKYILVLFTRNLDGLWYFADAAGKAGREWYGAWQTTMTTKEQTKIRDRHPDGEGLFDVGPLLPPSEPFDADVYEADHRAQWTATIADTIARLLKDGPFVPAERVNDVYGTLLGAAGERHVKAAMNQLKAAGVIGNDTKDKTWFRQLVRAT